MYYIGLNNIPKSSDLPQSSDTPQSSELPNNKPPDIKASPVSQVINKPDISTNAIAALNPQPKIQSDNQFGWILPLVKSRKSKFLNDYMVWPIPTKKDTCYNCGIWTRDVAMVREYRSP